MLDISLQNFETELIAASMRQPVLLDIWAPWCGPCKALGPVLERLETSYAGRFVLAKLNSDEQPEIAAQLSQMFGVRSIPFCVLFKGGQPVDGFVGALPEAQVRSFLDKHVPSVEEVATDDDVEQAESLLAEGDVDKALDRLRDALALAPDNDGARYDYLHALLSAGRLERACEAFDPVAAKAIHDQRLAACEQWLVACEQAPSGRTIEQLEAALSIDKRDLQARFELAQRHFAAQRFTRAMDDLLEILMRDKGWRDGLARKTYVAVLTVMSQPTPHAAQAPAQTSALELSGRQVAVASSPLVDTYRRKLSMAVF